MVASVFAQLDGFSRGLVDKFRQPLLHRRVVEDIGTEIGGLGVVVV
jgi:hypothetical protein